MRLGKVEIFERSDGLWDWRVVAGNSEIVAGSAGQGYTSTHDAERGWETARELIRDAVLVVEVIHA